MQRTVVPSADRERFLERGRALRTHSHPANCRYWVFEDTEVTGAFLEFAEASDASALTAAQAGAPEEAHVGPMRVYREVEL